MDVTPRFEQAVLKLYNAFHSNTLNPECCKQCAVGNILDQRDFWKNLSDQHGSTNLNYVGKVNEAFGKRFNGYTPAELLNIEVAFLKGCGFSLPLSRNSTKPPDPTSQETLFRGLSAAVSCLCRLDGAKDVMDCSELFNFTIEEQPLEPLCI